MTRHMLLPVLLVVAHASHSAFGLHGDDSSLRDQRIGPRAQVVDPVIEEPIRPLFTGAGEVPAALPSLGAGDAPRCGAMSAPLMALLALMTLTGRLLSLPSLSRACRYEHLRRRRAFDESAR